MSKIPCGIGSHQQQLLSLRLRKLEAGIDRVSLTPIASLILEVRSSSLQVPFLHPYKTAVSCHPALVQSLHSHGPSHAPQLYTLLTRSSGKSRYIVLSEAEQTARKVADSANAAVITPEASLPFSDLSLLIDGSYLEYVEP